MIDSKLNKIYESVQYKQLISRIQFVLFVIFLFVISTNITVPGINLEVWRQFISGSGNLFAFFGLFTGGALNNFAITSLGIIPYIDAAIIMQLLIAGFPQLAALQKEYGEEGRKKINFYTKWLAIVIAILQATFATTTLYKINPAIFHDKSLSGLFIVIVSLVGGSIFLMYLADQINEKGIGNGSSILIFSSILFRLPRFIINSVVSIGSNLLNNFLVIGIQIIFFIFFVAIVAFLSLSIRKISIMITQRVFGGNKVVQQRSTFLPLPLLSAGVLPIIFAVALLYFPITVLQAFKINETIISNNILLSFIYKTIVPSSLVIPSDFNLNNLQIFFNSLFWNLWHSIIYATLIIIFTYFYTFIIINVDDLSDYLNKSGAVILGIKPGQDTKKFLEQTLYRLAFISGLALSFITISPPYFMYIINWILSKITGVQELSLMGLVGYYISGSSMLIIVGVVLDILKQMNAFLVAANPRELFKKY
ncbi:MAG: preprotein translocase subunit SecY [bacterium]